MSSIYTATVVINRPPADVFEFVRVPENQVAWGVNFVRATQALGGGRYAMDTPVGRLTYRIASEASSGTIDFWFETSDGESVMPARVVPHPRGATFMFTITRAPGTETEEWERGQRGLDEELTVLKRLLEDGAGRS